MRKLILALVTCSALVAVPAAASARGSLSSFATGIVVGGLLFGGDAHGDARGDGKGTIIYSAGEETLKKVDPLSVRMVSTDYGRCNFHKEENKTNKSFGEVFSNLMENRPGERIILQILRIFVSHDCATIWFAYVEQ